MKDIESVHSNVENTTQTFCKGIHHISNLRIYKIASILVNMTKDASGNVKM